MKLNTVKISLCDDTVNFNCITVNILPFKGPSTVLDVESPNLLPRHDDSVWITLDTGYPEFGVLHRLGCGRYNIRSGNQFRLPLSLSKTRY